MFSDKLFSPLAVVQLPHIFMAELHCISLKLGFYYSRNMLYLVSESFEGSVLLNGRLVLTQIFWCKTAL